MAEFIARHFVDGLIKDKRVYEKPVDLCALTQAAEDFGVVAETHRMIRLSRTQIIAQKDGVPVVVSIAPTQENSSDLHQERN